MEPTAAEVERGLNRVIDAAPSLPGLHAHRIEFAAARRWRSLGRRIPDELADQERRTTLIDLSAPALMLKVRASCEGTLLLIKGPEVASRYPNGMLRPFKDLDLVVEDAERTQRELLAAGFVEVGDPALYVGIHHLRPLCWPTLPLTVEIHDRLKWPVGLRPPTKPELFADAVPAAIGVDGVVAPQPAHHALLLAAHAWAHRPLDKLRDLIDVAFTAAALDRDELRLLARRWDMSRVWRTTSDAIAGVLVEDEPTIALRLWAPHLSEVRERTVLENHLQRCLSPLWALPPWRATPHVLRALSAEASPSRGETWEQKLRRTRRAFRNARRQRSEHERLVGRDRSEEP